MTPTGVRWTCQLCTAGVYCPQTETLSTAPFKACYPMYADKWKTSQSFFAPIPRQSLRRSAILLQTCTASWSYLPTGSFTRYPCNTIVSHKCYISWIQAVAPLLQVLPFALVSVPVSLSRVTRHIATSIHAAFYPFLVCDNDTYTTVLC